MNKKITTFSIVAISCMFIFSYIPNSEAKLWDYLVDIELIENSSNLGNEHVLIGTVFDHAYRPVSNVDVKVTFAGKSNLLQTDIDGEFGKELETSELKPRTYVVQIFVSSDDGKKGMTSTILEINGHVEKSAKFDRQLESLEIANDVSKLRFSPNDPISVILYEHYLKLQDQLAEAKYQEDLLNAPQQKIQEIRQQVHEKLMQTLDERPLPTRQFDQTIKFSKFLDNLDDEKKYLFELQMNSTKIRFIEAQNTMQALLQNGTSYDNARLAYLEHLSITQDEMSSFTENMEKSESSPKQPTNSTEN